MTFQATDEDAGEAAYRRSSNFQRFERTDLVNRRISIHRRIDCQQISVWDSNVQFHRLIHRPNGVPATGDRRPATGDRRLASRRIRFQRSTQQIGTQAKRRIGDRRVAVSDSNVQHSRLVHRRSGVPATFDQRVATSDSNVQHNRLVHRRSGVPVTGESPCQIPTFNTTDWYTGKAAYRRPASRRVRFQRPTQQIGTPANWRTDVSAPNATTRQISTQANRRTHDRRPVSVGRIPTPRSPTRCRNWR